jgi:hypothetical protein
MLLEPHKIEDKFLSRFIKNSFNLFLKNPIAWTVFIFVLFLISAVFNSVPFLNQDDVISTSLEMIIGVWTLFLGFEFAANIDYNTFNIKHTFQYFKISLKYSVYFIKDNFIYIISFIITLSILHLILSSIEKSKFTNSETYMDYSIYFFNMTYIIFLGILFALHRSRIFYYPIMRQFFINDSSIAYYLSKKSLDINQNFKIFLYFVYPLVIIMIYKFTLLFRTLFFIPFIPFFHLILYTAFREIFLNKKENEKEEVYILEHNLNHSNISN